MKEKFLSPVPFLKMIEFIIKFYFHVFRHIFWIVVFLALLQAIIPALSPVKPSVGIAISILSIIVFMFFHAWALYHADTVLMERNETIWQSLQMTKHRFINVLGAIFLYLILAAIFSFLIFSLVRLGGLMGLDILFFALSVMIIIYFTVLFAFSIPAIVIDGMPIIKAFEQSVRLVWHHWWRTFGIMAIFSIPIILLSLGVVLLTQENMVLITIYEFFYHIIAYPLFLAFTLILYHDLRYRHQAEAFKHLGQEQQDHQVLK